MKSLASLFIFTFVFHASAAEKFNPDPANKMEAKGIVSVTVPWIKDKGKKYDINLIVHDDSDEKGIIFFLSDMGCKRGASAGSLKHTFFNTGERTIDFKPGQTKTFNMVCDTQSKATGPFTLTIAKVYDNPSLDGKTVGKVIAKGLSWTQDDRRE